MYKYGSFGKRLLAFIVDQLIIILGIIPLVLIDRFVNIGNANGLRVGLGILFVAYSILLVWRSGSTIGKRIFKLKVVSSDYQPIGFWRTFLREGIGKVISGFFNLGYLWVLIDKKRQGWHDKIARTYVVEVDEKGNLISSIEGKITKGEKIMFWVLLLLIGIPLGLGIIFSLFFLFVDSPFPISGQDIISKFSF
ncbi:MAG: RDD family protein [Candidatus Daviesbacteria bacterium]|nr:RDD family protein [Candidatus Daviesbacteria bacterium]